MSTGRPAPVRQGATELGLRVASAVVMGGAALVATVQGGWIFAIFWLLAGAAVLFEWIAITRCEPRQALQIVLALLLVALSAVAFFSDLGAGGSLAACLTAAVAIAACGRTPRDRGWAAAGFVYASIIAVVPPLVREHPRLGVVGILWMFAVVWASDITAYFAGRRFGGPKLWPAISPKKTWAGLFGGLVAGIGAGVSVVVVAKRLGWSLPVGLVLLVLMSAVASLLGQLGDLGESALKRRFGVKDSGHLIPGHGGLMDRLDAFWAVSALLGLLLAANYGFGVGG